jgi:hypothetical protein
MCFAKSPIRRMRKTTAIFSHLYEILKTGLTYSRRLRQQTTGRAEERI